MNKIYVPRGLPGSGKTEWSRKKAEETGAVRVNKDDLRAMMDNGKWSKSNERLVLQVRDLIITAALDVGRSIIVDDTNLDPKHIARIRELSTIHHVEVVDFTTVPVDVCIERDRKRPNYVGEKVISDMWKRYLAPPPPEPPSYNPSLPAAIMDGRSAYDWERVGEDKPNCPVIHLVLRERATGCRVIVVSGWDGCCEILNKDWFASHGVSYDDFYMRATEDNRDDRIIKREIYERHIKGRFNVRYVLDDRNKVVDMWRNELGLQCFQVADGDF